MIRICGLTASVFLLSLLFSGCHSQAGKKFYKLRVAIDNDEGFYLDSIYLNAPYQRNQISPEYPVMEYDTLTPLAYFRFDSVQSGELTIYCQSQLNSLFEKKILLHSDTTIIIRQNELPAFQKTSFGELDIDSLSIGEKMTLSVSMSGCFNQHKEKMIIERAESDWKLIFTSTRQTDFNGHGQYTRKEITLPVAFLDSLQVFSKSMVEFEANAGFGGCTTNYTYYAQKGNRYATCNDGTCSDFIRYNALQKLILPEWFKDENGGQ